MIHPMSPESTDNQIFIVLLNKYVVNASSGGGEKNPDVSMVQDGSIFKAEIRGVSTRAAADVIRAADDLNCIRVKYAEKRVNAEFRSWQDAIDFFRLVCRLIGPIVKMVQIPYGEGS